MAVWSRKVGFWCQIIVRKYGIPQGSRGSGLWKDIVKGYDLFSRMVTFKVGRGYLVRFWLDVWCNHVQLKTLDAACM